MTKQEQWRITASKLQELKIEVERLISLHRADHDEANVEMLTNFIKKPLVEITDTLNAV